MKLEELIESLKLNEEQTEIVKKFQQSCEDVIRTDYSKKIKDVNDELTKYKPVEKTAEQIELEQLRQELAETKFQKNLKEIGVKDDLAKYLKQDIDIEDFKRIYEQFNTGLQDFVPNSKNINDVGITKEQFRKMTYGEKEKIYTENPELFQMLSK